MALPVLDVPTYVLNLPSSGKKIKYRPFLVKEHKILLTLSEASDDEVARIVHELIDACTFNEIKSRDLPHFDIEYIFMQLRAKSIGEQVDVVITCTDCDHKYEHSYNIEDLIVEKEKDHSNMIKLTDSVGIEMKYPKFESVVQILDSQKIDDVFNLVKKSIKGVYQEDSYYDITEQTDEEINEFLLSLTKDQFEKIEKFFTSSPKIVQIVKTDCPNCGKHNTSRIEGLQNFFV